MKKIVKYKKLIIIALIILGALMISSTALAGLANWPDSPLGTPLDIDGSKTGTKSTLVIFVKYLYEWGIALGGLAAFIALIISGFLYLTSTGDPAKMNEAKNRATWAIGGLVLLLSSWLILYTINPELTILRELPQDFDEELIAAMSCQTDADCIKWGEDYVCDDNICRLLWEDLLKQRPCDRIHIVTEGAPAGFPGCTSMPIVIDMGEFFYYRPGTELEILLEPGEKFWYWTDPDDEPCWGLLQIYEGAEVGRRCSKDYQPFLVEGTTEKEKGYGQTQATIFCMEFIEVPGWDVPEFKHRPRTPAGEDPSVPGPEPGNPFSLMDAPEACGMTFTESGGTTGAANWWCHTNLFGDPNRYHFCVNNWYYSFECRGWFPRAKCDSATAVKKYCSGGCTSWACERGKGCTEAGEMCSYDPTYDPCPDPACEFILVGPCLPTQTEILLPGSPDGPGGRCCCP